MAKQIISGQMSLFDFIDEPIEMHKCVECQNAKFKEILRNGIALYYCHVARSYITVHTLERTFHKNCFERRMR